MYSRLLSLVCVLYSLTALAAERPNVVILLADDLGYGDIGVYGSPTDYSSNDDLLTAPIRTPNIDRLAAQGIRFTDYYAAAPNCSPSRAGLLTGRTPSRVGVYDYVDPGSPMHLPTEEVTLAERLKALGYATCHVGKWHLSPWVRDPEAPLQSPTPGDQGFDYWFAADNNAVPSHLNPTNFLRMNEPVGELEGYSCQLVADEGIQWLREREDKDAPFYLNVWFNEPHQKIASPPELIAGYPDVSPKDAEYYANIENMDAAAGRILDALDELGLSENTFVLFMSDNGPLRDGSQGPLREKKSSLYEGGIRVPGIIRWPGVVEPGRVSKVPVGAVDIVPTLMEALGESLELDRTFDGQSVLSLLAGGDTIVRRKPLFWFFYKSTPMCVIRSGDWVLAGNPEETYRSKSHPFDQTDFEYLKREKMVTFELYNVAEDIGQTNDLAPQLPEQTQNFVNAMNAIHAGVIAEGVTWEGLWEE